MKFKSIILGLVICGACYCSAADAQVSAAPAAAPAAAAEVRSAAPAAKKAAPQQSSWKSMALAIIPICIFL